jgi:hypothetical protein
MTENGKMDDHELGNSRVFFIFRSKSMREMNQSEQNAQMTYVTFDNTRIPCTSGEIPQG